MVRARHPNVALPEGTPSCAHHAPSGMSRHGSHCVRDGVSLRIVELPSGLARYTIASASGGRIWGRGGRRGGRREPRQACAHLECAGLLGDGTAATQCNTNEPLSSRASHGALDTAAGTRVRSSTPLKQYAGIFRGNFACIATSEVDAACPLCPCVWKHRPYAWSTTPPPAELSTNTSRPNLSTPKARQTPSGKV